MAGLEAPPDGWLPQHKDLLDGVLDQCMGNFEHFFIQVPGAALPLLMCNHCKITLIHIAMTTATLGSVIAVFSVVALLNHHETFLTPFLLFQLLLLLSLLHRHLRILLP